MENNLMPKHVAIILDGNGRWATSRGLKRSEGHKAGYDTLRKLAIYALSLDIDVLSVYAFSTENFKRSKEEVDYLMNLFLLKFRTEDKYFNKYNIRVLFSGRSENLDKKVLDAMRSIETKTKNNTKILNICLNYGGHFEIIDAVKKIVNDKIDVSNLDEETFNKYLYQDLRPIDFLIRTSGEQRLSNFMLWQMSYAEMYFTNTYFPDFNEKEFDKALEAYKNRNRRFGGVNETKTN